MPTFFIKHSIPGRVRLKTIRKTNASLLAEISTSLEGVYSTRCNPACASVIILYDQKVIKKNELLERIANLLDEKQLFPDAPAPKPAAQPVSACSCAAPPPENTTKKNLARFLSLSAVAGYIFTKEILMKKAVIQSLFSPLGVIALIASAPLLKESLLHAREKRFTLEGFLAGGCALAAISGQAVTAIEILWIHSGAETLKSWVSERSRRSISDILALTAKNTFVLRGDVEVEVPVEAVRVRDIVVLHTGEKISVDGEVLSGEALVDDSPITGRAEFALVSKGNKVFAGSYVRQGVIHVRAECVGDHTYLARIMRQVEDSLETRAPIESVADRLAQNMVRLGFLATAGTLFFTGSLWRAFTVLMVMACPCATVLSAQTAVSAAMSAAARKGILIKGGRYLEEVGKADTVCFDKTGTLTSNQPRIESILNFSDLSENELLLWAYSAEMHNHHPLALAIKKEATAREIDPISHVECEFTLGKGVRATIGASDIRIGNRRYLEEAGIDTAHAGSRADPLDKKGLTVIFLAKDSQVLAAFGFANQIRPNAVKTVSALYGSGVKNVVIITGDTENTARDLSARLGIEECHHSVLPEEKGGIVTSLRKNGEKVIMVGDGINDALALAESDIGIAMSAGGSDVAIEAADIALVHDRLEDIIYLRELSQQTMRVAKQNFWLATSTNIGGALAGALGLMSPVAAGLLHIAHTLGVLANSSRLLLFNGKGLRDTSKALPCSRTSLTVSETD